MKKRFLKGFYGMEIVENLKVEFILQWGWKKALMQEVFQFV